MPIGNSTYSVIASTVAAVLAGAALATALTSSGPRGVQGPAGKAGTTTQSAQTARLGICYGDTWGTTTDGTSYVTTVSIASPVLSDGVYQCPQGLTFTSVVPQAQQTSAG
jgi:hypothetical protein